jgi:hypothetical protein
MCSCLAFVGTLENILHLSLGRRRPWNQPGVYSINSVSCFLFRVFVGSLPRLCCVWSPIPMIRHVCCSHLGFTDIYCTKIRILQSLQNWTFYCPALDLLPYFCWLHPWCLVDLCDPPHLADLQCCSGNFVQGRRGSALAFHIGIYQTFQVRPSLFWWPSQCFFIETLIKVVVGGL